MKDFAGKVAVITGAGSGFGREFARIGASLGMRLVLADVQADALAAVVDELRERGVEVIGEQVDVSKGDEVERLAQRTKEAFGKVHLLFNNAGVAAGGLVWESTEKDWQWTLGVNLWGVIHGVRCFVPMMLEQGDECHVVNTASVAGLLSTQLMGVYNVSKHGVVTLTETLYNDLRLSNANIGVTLLCPAFVPTGIHASERNRPAELASEGEPTASMIASQKATEKATSSGKISAEDVAKMTFDAIRENRFYVVTHPKILASVELRMQDVVAQRNPSDPFTFKKDVAVKPS
ncbi:MAG TPA: SDR family oxidoreductase [Burkholderiaceae bacterium]|nr:SDR family oxidoreductase [Burkholderiaceae bacterium]